LLDYLIALLLLADAFAVDRGRWSAGVDRVLPDINDVETDDVAMTDPRVEPITHPRDQFISVHLRQKILFLPVCLRVCG
jgi:hypothetical protein